MSQYKVQTYVHIYNAACYVCMLILHICVSILPNNLKFKMSQNCSFCLSFEEVTTVFPPLPLPPPIPPLFFPLLPFPLHNPLNLSLKKKIKVSEPKLPGVQKSRKIKWHNQRNKSRKDKDDRIIEYNEYAHYIMNVFIFKKTEEMWEIRKGQGLLSNKNTRRL